MIHAAQRPRLLFLSQTLPYPPDGGVHIRTYNILRLLAREYDVTALCFYRRATRRTPAEVEASVAALSKLARVEAFAIPQEHSRLRLWRDHARSLLGRRVYTVPAYEAADYRHRIEQLMAEQVFDLVHVDSLDLSAYLPLLHGVPVVCVHHNVESALLARRATVEPSRVRSAYLKHQAQLMAQEERRWCAEVDLNVMVSAEDRALLLRSVPEASTVVVPNGVDTLAFQPALATRQALVFVGGYGWFPNRDALHYFCGDILPLVRAAAPHAVVWWVGRAPDDVQRRMREEYGVQLTGYVDDIRPYVQDAACYIVPLRVGGGTRLKILDAWAMGKAVVSTSVGCEGLTARDGENILIRDTPDAFAEAIRAVLSDDGLRTHLEANARLTAEQEYDWEVIGRPMLEAYRQLLATKR